MDQWQNNKASQSSLLNSRRSLDAEAKDPIAVRKVQKADREKLRRDRLNDQFLELGNSLDPGRPKNDKATILTDTIEILRDLTAEVNKLKAECASLAEESRELIQEKNELRDEKSSLKLDIENLNAQYQQRLRVAFPWGAVEPSCLMGSPYSYPLPMAMPPCSMAMHPSLQPYPFFGSQNASAIPSSLPAYMPYSTPANPPVEQQPIPPPTTSHAFKPECRSKALDSGKIGHLEKNDDLSDVATELELKMPGCVQPQESLCSDRKSKHSQNKERSSADGGSSSKLSSCQGPQESSSNSVSHIPYSDK